MKDCSLCPLFAHMTPREFQRVTFEIGYREGLRAASAYAGASIVATEDKPFGPTEGMSDAESGAFSLGWFGVIETLDREIEKRTPTAEQLDAIRLEVLGA